MRVQIRQGGVRIRRGSVGHAFGWSTRLDPVGEASAIVANVRVAEFMEQGDRLLGASSGELPAVNGDLGGEVGKQLARASWNLLEREC